MSTHGDSPVTLNRSHRLRRCCSRQSPAILGLTLLWLVTVLGGPAVAPTSAIPLCTVPDPPPICDEEDTSPPTGTAFDGGPATPETNATTAAFSNFRAAGLGDQLWFQCRLDRPDQMGVFSECGDPLDDRESYTQLVTNGRYTFHLRAVDAHGNVDPQPATKTWIVDTIPPAAPELNGGPDEGALVATRSASFQLVLKEGSKLSCKLTRRADDSVVQEHPCDPGPIAYTVPSDGGYTFMLTASDEAGNLASVSRHWTVDTIPPAVSITAGPSENAPSNDSNPMFAFVADDQMATLWCSIDLAPPTLCLSTATYSSLADGLHVFSVYATDGRGLTGATARRTWSIDTVAPETALLSAPVEGSTSPIGTASLSFASPDPSARFECRFVDEAFRPCLSPLTYARLPTGDYTFEVRAVDAAGNGDPSPARRSWRVNILDLDADGHNRGQDCDDTNPAIHPGAHDTPGNSTDEDCTGSPARYPHLDTTITYQVTRSRRGVIVFRALSVRPGRAGSTVVLRCAGRGCVFRRKSRVVKRDTRALDLSRLVRNAKLRPGAQLEVTVTKPRTIGVVKRFKVTPPDRPFKPIDRCIMPGTKKPIVCMP